MVAGFLRLDTELVQFGLYNILFEVSSESRLHHGLIGVYGCSLVLKCARLCRQCSGQSVDCDHGSRVLTAGHRTGRGHSRSQAGGMTVTCRSSRSYISDGDTICYTDINSLTSKNSR